MASKAMSIFNELKDDRSYVRTRIKNRVLKLILTAVKGGFFPTFDNIMIEVMDEVASIMEENTKISTLVWQVLLQKNEPDSNCEKTTQLVKVGEALNDLKTVISDLPDEKDQTQELIALALSMITENDEPEEKYKKLRKLCQSAQDVEKTNQKTSSPAQEVKEDSPSVETADSKPQK